MVGRGNISASLVEKYLEPSIDKDAFLISDKNHAYQKFSRENNVTHIGLKSGMPDKKIALIIFRTSIHITVV